MQSSAYGASLAGGAFDFPSFVRQPQTILRCLSWVSDSTETLTLASKLLASCHFTDRMLTDVRCQGRHKADSDTACQRYELLTPDTNWGLGRNLE